MMVRRRNITTTNVTNSASLGFLLLTIYFYCMTITTRNILTVEAFEMTRLTSQPAGVTHHRRPFQQIQTCEQRYRQQHYQQQEIRCRSCLYHHGSMNSEDDYNLHDEDTLATASKNFHAQEIVSKSRRSFLSAPLMLPVMMGGMIISSTSEGDVANAAGPITVQDTENFNSRLQRALREKPPKLLRPKLKLEFAVLLMRSSYQAVDQVDCVAMDQFQRDFFVIRQAEYQPYVELLGPGMVQQGDLTDPFYFDFISFAQYMTINREITADPPMVFEEQQPIDQGEDQPMKFVPVVVKRDPSITNDKLGIVHSKTVGSMVLNKFDELYGNTDIALPKLKDGNSAGRVDPATLQAALKQMVNYFLVNGFALSGSVERVEKSNSSGDNSGIQYKMVLNAPATLWGGRALQQQGSTLQNDFLLKTAKEYVTQAGYLILSSSVKYSGTSEESYLTVR